jgi:hypothetical protein
MRRYPSGRRAAIALALFVSTISCASRGGDAGEAKFVVTGVVVEIESRGLNEVQSFTVKSGDRRVKIFVEGDTQFAFTPSHLNEHRATGEPVAVEVDRRDGDLVALSVQDG